MNEWFEQIDQIIRRKKLFCDGQSILIAVSGGCDSMVLLHTLHALASRHQWRLAVCHFDHQIRPNSSEDALLVQHTAKSLGIPFTLGHGHVKELARKTGVSTEMAARTLRHKFLAKTAQNLNISTIALAHHASDQLELFFLRLIRGAGSEGISGMKWTGPSPVDPAIQLTRPFLSKSKEELEKIAREQHISFAIDATNASLDILRNRIRHELIPLLEKHYQPALNQVVGRLMELVGAESEFVAQTAGTWLVARRKTTFSHLPIAVQRQCLRQQLFKLNQSIDFEQLERLRLHPDTPITIAPTQQLIRNKNGIVSTLEMRSTAQNQSEHSIRLDSCGKTSFDESEIEWSVLELKGPLLHPEKNTEFFDANKIGKQITLRHWKPGDRFQQIGSKTPAKLQDLFVNAKVPQNERHCRLVAVAENGDIFWVEGLRISELFKLTSKTSHRLKWQWKEKRFE